VDLAEQLHRDRVSVPDALNCEHHGVDVPEHLSCGHVRRCLIEATNRLRVQQRTGADLKTLDTRGRYRFGAEQDPSQRLSIHQGAGVRVQHRDRGLGLCRVSGDLPIQYKLPVCEEIRYVCLVIA
jgi:hypothetical protein